MHDSKDAEVVADTTVKSIHFFQQSLTCPLVKKPSLNTTTFKILLNKFYLLPSDAIH